MIDLCVVSYNTRDLLVRQYNHVTQHAAEVPLKPLARWFYADNGSTDGSVEWLKWMEEAFPGSATYRYNENIGYSAACNQLAALGEGDIIGLLNADVWFTHADLSAIQKRFDEHPEIAILGPKQRDERGRITHGGIMGRFDSPKQRGWHESDPADKLYKGLDEAVTVSGAAFFIRRSVWNELWNCPIYRSVHPDATGAFLPTPHYYEETFCAYHARAHGHRAFYDGSISIGHSWHASSEVRAKEDREKFLISREIFRKACDAHGIQHD